MITKVHMDRLIKHLRTQIEFAEHLNSDFVYITKIEAQACLEIAEAEEKITSALEAIKPVVVAHDYGTEYKCGNCGALMIFSRTGERLSADLKRTKSFCSACGKGVDWNG